MKLFCICPNSTVDYLANRARGNFKNFSQLRLIQKFVSVTKSYNMYLARIKFSSAGAVSTIISSIADSGYAIIFTMCPPLKVLGGINLRAKGAMTTLHPIGAGAPKGGKDESAHPNGFTLAINAYLYTVICVIQSFLQLSGFIRSSTSLALFVRPNIAIFTCKVSGELRYWFKHMSTQIKSSVHQWRIQTLVERLTLNPGACFDNHLSVEYASGI